MKKPVVLFYKDLGERQIRLVNAHASLLTGRYKQVLLDGYPYGKIDLNYAKKDWEIRKKADEVESLLVKGVRVGPLIPTDDYYYDWPVSDVASKVIGAEHPLLLKSHLLLKSMIEVASLDKLCSSRVEDATKKKKKRNAEEEFGKSIEIGINNIVKIVPLYLDYLRSNDWKKNSQINIIDILNAIEQIPVLDKVPLFDRAEMNEINEKASGIWDRLKNLINNKKITRENFFQLMTVYENIISSLRKKFFKNVVEHHNEKEEKLLVICAEGMLPDN